MASAAASRRSTSPNRRTRTTSRRIKILVRTLRLESAVAWRRASATTGREGATDQVSGRSAPLSPDLVRNVESRETVARTWNVATSNLVNLLSFKILKLLMKYLSAEIVILKWLNTVSDLLHCALRYAILHLLITSLFETFFLIFISNLANWKNNLTCLYNYNNHNYYLCKF